MKVFKLSILCIFVFTIISAHARMYQWIDPVSKITQFSGKPPVWYRSNNGGPRVIVFENKHIIDDTSISVSEAEQGRLRRMAFLQAETDRETAKEKLLQTKRLEAISEQKQGGKEQPVNVLSPPAETVSESASPVINAPAPPAAVTDAAVVNQMRMLIQAWEQKNAASAKALIEPGAPASR